MWHAVTTQADADALMSAFGSFHDGCIREMHVWGGHYVSPDFSMSCPETPDLRCRLIVQRQWDDPSTVELLFDRVSEISLTAPPNCDRIIAGASLHVDAEKIVWSPDTEYDETHLGTATPSKIVSGLLWWRAIKGGLGPELRYAALGELPDGIAF